MASLVMHAREIRNEVIFDITGAYQHVNIPKGKILFLKLEGEFVDILCDVNLEFKEHVRYEK